jgi:hypothetical protein
MRDAAAIQAALNLAARPTQARWATHRPLPSGMTFLLEIAAGNHDALAEARRITGRSDAHLRQVAGFFIEQSLLSSAADSYRVLGSKPEDAQETLRRHLGLLMKWLHPDIAERHRLAADVDRSVFAQRIGAAWNDVKTRERRSAYDQRQGRSAALGRRGQVARRPSSRRLVASPPLNRWTPRQRLRARSNEPLLMRIARLLWRRR